MIGVQVFNDHQLWTCDFAHPAVCASLYVVCFSVVILHCVCDLCFMIAGKSAERPILSEENIEHNVQSIQALLQKLLSQEGKQDIPKPVLLNKLDWFGAMPLLTFLRQV